MMLMNSIVIVGVLVAGMGSAALAQVPAEPQRTRVMTDLVACRREVADPDRLACYDRLVAALDQAETSGEVLVFERREVAEARRALFGFSITSLPLFARQGPDRPVEEIRSRLVRASEGGSGKWLFVLEDGSVWAQTDSSTPGRLPRPGADISVRQGAVGSYLLSVNGTRSVRVRRQQ